MPTVVLKLFDGQGTGWTEGQSGNYNASSFWEGDTHIQFQDKPLKTSGAVVFTRICYICTSKYLKKGHNSVRKG